MSDKELMQEALKWQEHIKVLANDHAEDELYQKRSKVFDWLIEQTEKVAELQEALKGAAIISNQAKGYIEENKRLREALEFYADESIYSARNKERAEITLDYGEKARQALEGDDD